jgi:two-component system chemotaxis response regulator CheB
MNKARVLVVDDSATMRSLVSAVLRSDPEIEVVGSAGDPLEAREAIKALNPDVVTLDIEMPNMNGLAFLEKIMRLRPMPVIMISTMTQHGAEASIHALELGAFDCVGKPTSGLSPAEAFRDLPAKVKAAWRANVRPHVTRAAAPVRADGFRPNGHVVAIGSSTGGVEALLTVISSMPRNCPPTVITQHMPPTFTRSFANRLNQFCAAEVSEAVDGAVLETGRVYLAPGLSPPPAPCGVVCAKAILPTAIVRLSMCCLRPWRRPPAPMRSASF